MFEAGKVADHAGNIWSLPTSKVAFGVVLITKDELERAISLAWERYPRHDIGDLVAVMRSEATARRFASAGEAEGQDGEGGLVHEHAIAEG